MSLEEAAAQLEAQQAQLEAALAEVDAPAAKKKKKKKKKDKDLVLGSSRGVETMFRTMYRVNMDLSALADTKANIMISINGLILSIMLASVAPKIDANPWLFLPVVVLLLGCLIALVFAVLSARPRVGSQPVSLEDVRADRANILFFGNFANMAQPDYVEGMIDLMRNNDLLYRNMIRDLYNLGIVLVKKFRLLRVSYNVFMIGLIAGVMSFITVFLWIYTSAGPQ
ncbi:MAG: Pycsar system effector family protein [Bacteroidota bacterium]